LNEKARVDCVPNSPSEQIVELYHKNENLSDFTLSKFVHEYFNLPHSSASNFSSDIHASTADHRNRL